MNDKDLVNAELERLHEILLLLLEADDADLSWVKDKIDFLYNVHLTPRYFIEKGANTAERLPF